MSSLTTNPRTSLRKKGEKERASRLGYRCLLPKLMLFSLTRVQRGHHEHAVMTQGKLLPTVVFPMMAFPPSSHSVSAQPGLLPLEVTLESQVGLASLCGLPKCSGHSHHSSLILNQLVPHSFPTGNSHPPPMTMAPTACGCLDVHTLLSIKK